MLQVSVKDTDSEGSTNNGGKEVFEIESEAPYISVKVQFNFYLA